MVEVKNFINYKKIETDLVKQVAIASNAFGLSYEDKFYSSKRMSYIETQVSLQDKLWQYFVEPDEFSMLNLSPIVKE